ncbi:MAG: HAD family phosphatase [Bacteroidetes bacterium]|nr:HAD family phosphatase [Bacteroidota bacterium]
MKIEAVIFDFGGVLYEIDYKAPVHAFAKLGLTEFEELYSKANQSLLFDDLETGRISETDFYSKLSSFLPNASLAEIQEAWNSILLQFLPERMPFIHALKKSGVRTFLFSNTNAIHSTIFEQDIENCYGLSLFYEAFEHVHYSQNLGMRKPHAESFLHLCQLHELNPKNTIFIDDSPQHVLGARETGLIGVLHDPSKMPSETLATYFIDLLDS